MFYNHEDHETECSDMAPERVYDVFNQLIESVNKDEDIREIDFRRFFTVLNKVQDNWSVYYPYSDLMSRYYELHKLVRSRDTFDSGAVYGSLGISQRFLNDFLVRRHRRMKLAVKDTRDASVPNEIRRPGFRYQLMTDVKGHGRYSSLGEGGLIEPRYSYCLYRR